MTTQESFKKRIRARMAKAGERYNAARRAVLAQPTPPPASSGWVARPDVSDERARENTGRGWDEWVAEIDAGPGREAGHTAIATWLREERGVDGWWAQGITVAYERITGLRLPGQMRDGTFSVSRSRVLELDPGAFRELLDDDDARAGLLPGLGSVRRSRPGVKTPRFALTDAASGEETGTLMFSLDPSGGRTRLVVTHEKLPSPEAAEAWKQHWSDWLDALAGAD